MHGRRVFVRLGLGLAALLAAAGAIGASAARAEAEELRVLVKEAPPFAWRDRDGSWAGLAVDLWRRVAEQAELPPCTYTESGLEELLDDLARGEADVGLGAISVTAEREERLDFSHNFLATGLGVAVGGGDGDASPWWWFRALVDRGMAWLLGGFVVGLVLVGLLLTWAERRANPAFRDADPKDAMRTGFWWTFVMALGHKGIFPKTALGRFLSASLMGASVLLLSVFVGAVASVLTVSHLEHRVQTPDDLRRVRVAAVRETTGTKYLRRERIRHRSFASLDDALEALASGDVDAVVHDRPLLLHAVREQSAGGAEVLPLVFDPQDYAFALAPGLRHREAINRALLEIRGTRWWRDLLFQHLGS